MEERTALFLHGIQIGLQPRGAGIAPRERLLAVLAVIAATKMNTEAVSLACELATSSLYPASDHRGKHRLVVDVLNDLGDGENQPSAQMFCGITRVDLISSSGGNHPPRLNLRRPFVVGAEGALRGKCAYPHPAVDAGRGLARPG